MNIVSEKMTMVLLICLSLECTVLYGVPMSLFSMCLKTHFLGILADVVCRSCHSRSQDTPNRKNVVIQKWKKRIKKKAK